LDRERERERGGEGKRLVKQALGYGMDVKAEAQSFAHNA